MQKELKSKSRELKKLLGDFDRIFSEHQEEVKTMQYKDDAGFITSGSILKHFFDRSTVDAVKQLDKMLESFPKKTRKRRSR